MPIHLHVVLLDVIFAFISFTGTLRRFLEHYGDEIELVVFVSDQDDVSSCVYCTGALLSAYRL